MKTCPYCAEKIQDAAIKCRYCGSLLNSPPDAAAVAATMPSIPSTETPEAATANAASNGPPPHQQVGGGIVVVGLVMALIGRAFSAELQAIGIIGFFVGIVITLKDNSNSLKYGTAFIVTCVLLAVVGMKKDDKDEETFAAETNKKPPPADWDEPDQQSTESVEKLALKSEGTAEKQPTPPRSQFTIGRSYTDMLAYLDSFFNLEKSFLDDGSPRYNGQSANGLAILEVIGEKDDLTQATLIIALPNDSPEAVMTNSALLMRFVKNSYPNWKGAEKWINRSIKKISRGKETVSTVRGTRKLEMQAILEMGMISTTVSHKDSK